MPPVCEDTIEQQDADAMAARLVYQDAEVMVEVVAQADFKPDMVNLTGSKSLSVRQTTACCFFHGDCTGLQERAQALLNSRPVKVVQLLVICTHSAVMIAIQGCCSMSPANSSPVTLAYTVLSFYDLHIVLMMLFRMFDLF